MKNLSYTQKVSVMKILMDLVLADGRIDSRETEFYTAIASELDLDGNAKEDVKTMNSLLALVEINEFDQLTKEKFIKLMGKMIVVDKDINYKEVKIYNLVNDFCQIHADFDSSEYPDMTFS